MESSKLTLRLLILIVVFLSIISCNKEDVEIQPCETLMNIVGTWRTDGMSRTFKDNYEVIDSLFIEESVSIVTKGRFKFINGFIEFSDVKFTYLDDMRGSYFLYSFPLYKFEIINNILLFDEIGIFLPQEHNGNSINGKWLSSQNITIYEGDKTPQFVSGIRNIEFEFNQENNTYSINCIDIYRGAQYNISDGTYNYLFDYPFVYLNNNESPGGELERGVFIYYSSNRVTFTK